MVPATDENLPVVPALVPLASHTATGCFAMREFATLALGYAACESEVRLDFPPGSLPCFWLSQPPL